MLKNYEIRKYQIPEDEIRALVKEKREILVRQQQMLKEQQKQKGRR